MPCTQITDKGITNNDNNSYHLLTTYYMQNCTPKLQLFLVNY